MGLVPKKEGHVLVNTEKYAQIDLSRPSQNASDLYLKKTTKYLYGTIKGGQNWINLLRDYMRLLVISSMSKK